MAPECPNCGKPADPVFATRQNGGQLRAWYYPCCHGWQPPILRERLWTREEWDKGENYAK